VLESIVVDNTVDVTNTVEAGCVTTWVVIPRVGVVEEEEKALLMVGGSGHDPVAVIVVQAPFGTVGSHGFTLISVEGSSAATVAVEVQGTVRRRREYRIFCIRRLLGQVEGCILYLGQLPYC